MNTALAGGSLSQDVPMAPMPGHSVTFTAWVRSADGAPLSGTLALWALGGDQESASIPFVASTEWTPVSITLSPARLGHTSTRAEIYLESTGRNLDIDTTNLAWN